MSILRISLKSARVNAKLTQSEAAKAIGISRSTLQNYETGETVPDWGKVKLIEKVYGLPADYIFFGKTSA